MDEKEKKPETLAMSVVQERTLAEIDSQVATAKAYPRDIATFRKRAIDLATMDQETAESCFYKLPKRKGSDEAIQGPSIRLAEICGSCYGNLRYGARVTEEQERYVAAQGVGRDVEMNIEASIEVRRPIVTKSGHRYGDDMINVTANAACSIALRNAIFKIVPAALIKPIYEAAIQAAIGTVETLIERRQVMVKRFGALGVSLDQILRHVEAAKLDDVGMKEMEQLIGIYTALRDGDTTVGQVFGEAPVTEASLDESKGMAGLKKKVAQRKAGKKKEAPEPAPEPAPDEMPAVTSDVEMPEGAEDAFPK